VAGFSVKTLVKSDLVMAALRRADKNAKRDAMRAMRQAVREVTLPAAKGRVPHGPSGKYAASIKAGASARGGASVYSKIAYARVLEYGRAPMVIRPKSARALSIPTEHGRPTRPAGTGPRPATPNGAFRVVHSPRYPARNVLHDAVVPLLPATARRVEELLIPTIKSYF